LSVRILHELGRIRAQLLALPYLRDWDHHDRHLGDNDTTLKRHSVDMDR
jgi:hypothetical protein